MKSFVRGSLLVAAISLLGAAANPVSAQEGRDKEIRLDFLTLQTSDGSTGIGVGFPGSVAVAFYMNPNVAIEPQLSLAFISGDGADGSVYGLGLFVPWYFAGDAGRSGFFVAPGLEYSKGTGDFETDGATDFGVDVGMKMTRNDRMSTRLALTFRDGDSFNEAVIGASFGIGLFWR